MKTLLSAMVLLMALDSQANIFSSRESYIHNQTQARMELTNVDQESQTARYYDHAEGKTKTISLSEVSKATKEEIDGVRSGNMVLVRFTENSYRACEVWDLYSNGIAHIGCQTGKIREEGLIRRQEVGSYTASTDLMIKEVSSLEGFKKKETVRLLRDVGDLKEGDTVKIEHIFASGSAMIQKKGFNFIDTSSLLMKEQVQIVDLKDLSQTK